MLDLLKQDAQVGDSLNLYLTTGDSVKGKIVEIGESYLLMDVDGVKRRYFPQLIGGWDVVPNDETTSINGVVSTADLDTMEDEEETSEVELNDILLSLFDKIYETENIDLGKTIITNAKVDRVIATGVSVITDSGDSFICHKGFMAGYSRANCTPGKRLFCGLPNNSGPQKGICYQSVLETNFEELRERFILAISAKPIPRRPIINSIIAYFKKNNSGKTTKKAISELRTKVKLLGGNTDKTDNSQIELFVSLKQYDKAFDLIEHTISTSRDDKQKSSLLLRRAQLYSTLKRYEDAVASYRELISFNEDINSPSTYLSHIYTELARLLLLYGDDEQAKDARNNALRLNPNNVVAQKLILNINDDSEENSFIIAKYDNRRLIDDDIDSYEFTDPEIVSLNGLVTNEIANRLLERANSLDDSSLYIEAAKAFRSLPVGSYDTQELEDSINSYSLYKIRSVYNSYKKVVFESDSIDGISVEQLNRIKDCMISYSFEAIESIVNDDFDAAEKMLSDCLLLELSSFLIIQKAKRDFVLEILNYTLDDLVEYCKRAEEEIVAIIIVRLVGYSIQCLNLWELLVLKSEKLNSLVSYSNGNPIIKQKIIDLTPNQNKRKIDDPNYVNVLREYESKRLKESFNKLRKIIKFSLIISSVSNFKTKFMYLLGKKHAWCFNETDKKSLVDINHLVSLLSLYQIRSKEERKDILANALLDIDKIIKWNSGPMTTTLGRFCFCPLLVTWKEVLLNLNSKYEYNNSCLLSIEIDSPYFTENSDKEKIFNVVLYNKSDFISEGFKLTIWIGDDQKNGVEECNDDYILPKSNVLIPIPLNQWGDLSTYDLHFAIRSKHQQKWSDTELKEATITNKRDISFNIDDIKWKDRGYPSEDMFKGRNEIVQSLKHHYCSNNRCYSYVLYGLSKTGKSTILDYLKRTIEGCVINESKSSKMVLPLYIDLGDVHGNTTKHNFWKLFINRIFKETRKFISKYLPEKADKLIKPEDFSQFVIEMSELNIHPLFMFDEFSYMQDIINDGYINSAFLQYMRTISADKDLVSFIFAGTYDIKQLIRDPKYNISGAFTYLKEPDKPIFEISHEAAEELINMMQGKLDFSTAAKREMHRLTGDVPFWIQKLCLNCATYAIENNKPDIGLQDLNTVVSKMTGEPCKLKKTDIPSLNIGTFKNTQILDTDTEEINIVLTSISHLMKNADMSNGVSYDQIKVLWIDNNVDILKYNIKDALISLCERKTLVYEDYENIRYYRYSIDLFRRWWLHEHIEFELELSDFIKKVKQ